MNTTMQIASAMLVLHDDVCSKMPLILQARGPKCKDMCEVGWACICFCLKEVFINTKLWLLYLMSGCCIMNTNGFCNGSPSASPPSLLEDPLDASWDPAGKRTKMQRHV